MRAKYDVIVPPAAIRKQGFTTGLEVSIVLHYKEVGTYADKRDEALESINNGLGNKVKTKSFPFFGDKAKHVDDEHSVLRFRIYCVDRATMLQAKLRIQF